MILAIHVYNLSPYSSLLGWNFEPSVKIETMEESSLELKRGPTLKVLVNNQTYLPKSQVSLPESLAIFWSCIFRVMLPTGKIMKF